MTDTASKKKAACECKSWKKIERRIGGDNIVPLEYYYYQCENCYRAEYPPAQAQKLFEYSKEHLFMFISDWILVWLYAGNGAPVSGITILQKQLFIILYEFAQKNNIPTENAGFRAYKFGPYTERIDAALEALSDLGLVHSIGILNTKNEDFYLTDAGKEAAKKKFDMFTDDQQKELIALHRDLQQFDATGIMTYVYKTYPEFTEKSIVFERTLHRRRIK